MDITGNIDVTDAGAVCAAVSSIFERRFDGVDFSILEQLYSDFSSLYRGDYPGYLACDTSYHDIHHVLDVTLAMARLVDGYEINHPGDEALGPDLALLGIIVVLFHDSGYIRRSDDTEHEHGAEYAMTHVSRSAEFMAEYLPTIGLQQWVDISGKLVHFTGHEFRPDEIDVDKKQFVLGSLAGTADVIAQMADIAYLEKCRDRLFSEFEIGGIARQSLPDGSEKVVYESPEDLLEKTPQFIKHTITERLDGFFLGLYHNVEVHFGGKNLYMEALEENCQHLELLLAKKDSSLLKSSLRPARKMNG